MNNSKHRIDVFKKTSDDWSPNFNQNLVEVSFINIKGAYNLLRVCVWGADDMGMEKDFTPNQEKMALATFMEVIGKKEVNKDCLTKLGFTPA